MIRFRKLLGEIFLNMKCLSKKAYTKGLVIITAGMVTVLLLGVNGFIVNSKTNPDQIYEQKEEEKVIEDNTVQLPVLIEKDLPQSSETIASLENPPLQREEEDAKTILQTTKSDVLEKKESIIYTEEDYIALVKIVEAEATGEDLIGKIMVANVVLNRVKSDQFPNTIHDVIYEKYNGRSQFSPVDDGRIESVPLTESTYEAVENALNGEDYSNGATFFVAKALATQSAGSWFDDNLQKVAEHGVHQFYSY